jgi:hypothetical protein
MSPFFYTLNYNFYNVTYIFTPALFKADFISKTIENNLFNNLYSLYFEIYLSTNICNSVPQQCFLINYIACVRTTN